MRIYHPPDQSLRLSCKSDSAADGVRCKCKCGRGRGRGRQTRSGHPGLRSTTCVDSSAIATDGPSPIHSQTQVQCSQTIRKPRGKSFHRQSLPYQDWGSVKSGPCPHSVRTCIITVRLIGIPLPGPHTGRAVTRAAMPTAMTQACLRCKQQKRKCDRLLPVCSLCQRSV